MLRGTQFGHRNSDILGTTVNCSSTLMAYAAHNFELPLLDSDDVTSYDVASTTKAYVGGLRLEPSVESRERWRNGGVNTSKYSPWRYNYFY